METEHTMDLKSQMDYGHRPPYHKDNMAILYLGNKESKHPKILAIDARSAIDITPHIKRFVDVVKVDRGGLGAP